MPHPLPKVAPLPSHPAFSGPPAPSDSHKKQLWKVDRRCRYCLTVLTLKQATVDHIIPKSKGGSDELSNKTIACDPCNKAKGNKTGSKWTPKF